MARPPLRIGISISSAQPAARARRVGEALLEQGDRGMGREAVAFGDPGRVAEPLAPYGELGFDPVVIRTLLVPQDEARRSVGLAGEVARRLGPGPA